MEQRPDQYIVGNSDHYFSITSFSLKNVSTVTLILEPDIKDWLEENLTDYHVQNPGINGEIDFMFDTPEDAMAFKLRWC